MVFCFVQKFFFGQHRLEFFFFCRTKREFLFPGFNIRLYDKNSKSDYFFFLHQNQNIFFSNIGKKTITPPSPFKLNGRSLNYKHSLTLILYCPCLCCHSFLWWCVISWVEVNLHRFFFSLDILLLRRGRLGPINLFDPTTFLCLSRTRIWISNVIWQGLFLCLMIWGERWLFILIILMNCWPSLFKKSLKIPKM